MVTMASLTADNTTHRCPITQKSIPKPSTSTPEPTASKCGTRRIDSTTFPTQSILREIPTGNFRISAAAAARIFTNDDEQTPPLTLTTHPTTVVDATDTGKTTLTPLCDNESYDYRSRLAQQTEELERMQASWLLLEASFDRIHSDSDASKQQSPSNHFTSATHTPRSPDTTSVPADVRSTDAILNNFSEKCTNINVEQEKQSKSLRYLMAMSEALIEGMNLIVSQLDTINCLLPPRYEAAQPHHPTLMTKQSGKTTITTTVPATQIKLTAVSNHINRLPQTNAPPWPPPRPVRPLKPPQSTKSCPHKKPVQTKFPVNGQPSVPSRTKDCLRPP